MLLAKCLNDSIVNNKILNRKLFLEYSWLYNLVEGVLTALYLLSLYSCVDICYGSLILPLLKKIITFIKNICTMLVKMSGFDGSSGNQTPTPSPNPHNYHNSPNNPEPSPNSSSGMIEKKRKRKNKVSEAMVTPEEFEKDKLDLNKELIRMNKSMQKYNTIDPKYEHKIVQHLDYLMYDYGPHLLKKEHDKILNIVRENVIASEDKNNATAV